MKKWIAVALLIVIAILALNKFIFLPKNSRYIPENSAAVVSFDIASLAMKADYKELLENKIVKHEIEDLGKPFTDWIDKPTSTGIDWRKSAYLSISLPEEEYGDPIFSLIIPVQSRKKIEEALSDFWKEETGEPIKLIKEDGYTRVKMEEQSEVQIGFNKKTLIITFSDFDPVDPKLLSDLFGQKNAPKHPGLRPFLRSNDDVAGWINYTALKSMASELGLPVSNESCEAATLALNFEKGKIEGSATAYYADGSRKKMAGKGISSALTKALPRDAVAYAAISVDMKNYTDILLTKQNSTDLGSPLGVGFYAQAIKSITGLTDNEIQDLFSGDFAFAFIEMEEKTLSDDEFSTINKTPAPSFVIAADVADADNCKKLLSSLEQNAITEALNMIGIELFERKGKLYCGMGDFMDRLKDKGKAEKAVNGKIKRLLRKHHMAVYVDLERAADLLKTFDLLDEDTLRLMRIFKSAELTGDFKRKTEEAALSIQMSDKKQNSLKTIIEQVLELID
ncbi:MAG: DUF4836 family protein [Pontiellaceae bacterium]|nr:DUF4836 family protein [Pontiellaceae bacterium]